MYRTGGATPRAPRPQRPVQPDTGNASRKRRRLAPRAHSRRRRCGARRQEAPRYERPDSPNPGAAKARSGGPAAPFGVARLEPKVGGERHARGEKGGRARREPGGKGAGIAPGGRGSSRAMRVLASGQTGRSAADAARVTAPKVAKAAHVPRK